MRIIFFLASILISLSLYAKNNAKNRPFSLLPQKDILDDSELKAYLSPTIGMQKIIYGLGIGGGKGNFSTKAYIKFKNESTFYIPSIVITYLEGNEDQATQSISLEHLISFEFKIKKFFTPLFGVGLGFQHITQFLEETQNMQKKQEGTLFYLTGFNLAFAKYLSLLFQYKATYSLAGFGGFAASDISTEKKEFLKKTYAYYFIAEI